MCLDLSGRGAIQGRDGMTIADNYDVIVVGGGPAGCMAAYEAAKMGVSVLLLEKDRELGVPVRW